MLKALSRIIFYIILFFLIICFWTLTIGQKINIEFSDSEIASKFYYYVFTFTPILILLTLIGTIRKKNSKIKNGIIIFLTAILSLIVFSYLLQNMFSIGFGNWENMEILYTNKKDKSKKIIKQQYDAGALGYGNYRIVEITNFTKYFNKIDNIDTMKVNKTEWKKVNINIDKRK